jgi:hypothetical protein
MPSSSGFADNSDIIANEPKVVVGDSGRLCGKWFIKVSIVGNDTNEESTQIGPC